MKAFLCALLISLSTNHSLVAQSVDSTPTTIFSRFKLQVFQDEKPTEFFIVGHLSILNAFGQLKVTWCDVWISPIHNEKRVMLKPEYNSLEDGDIKEISVADGRFSFRIVLAPERVMQVSGTKKLDEPEYHIQAVGLWWVELLKKNVKTEWRSVLKPIVLPYAEVF